MTRNLVLSAALPSSSRPVEVVFAVAFLIGTDHQSDAHQALPSRYIAVPLVRDDRMERRGQQQVAMLQYGFQPVRDGDRVVVEETVGDASGPAWRWPAWGRRLR